MNRVLLAIEGKYRNGKVELAEEPVGVVESPVIVTFLNRNGAKSTIARRQAGQRLIEDMRQGLDFGGARFNREELYNERMRRLG